VVAPSVTLALMVPSRKLRAHLEGASGAHRLVGLTQTLFQIRFRMVMGLSLCRFGLLPAAVGPSLWFLSDLGRKLERWQLGWSWRHHLVPGGSWSGLKDCSKLDLEWSWFFHCGGSNLLWAWWA
jgi:hypothetical protein